MNYVLGVDAGGTKTVCLLAGEEGRVLAEGRGGGANLQAAGELEVEKVLHEVMEEALGDRGVAPSAICLGIAGVDRPEDERVIRAVMRRIGYKARTIIVNDALVALAAGTHDRHGVAVIAGTGSIAYGINRAGEAARAGGWGSVLGDEGSGYWIGWHALQAVVREDDGRGPRTALTLLFLQRFGITRASELIHEVYYKDLKRHQIAALSALVEQARAAGDTTAFEIMDAAAAELALSAHSVIDRLGMRDEEFVVLLAGGLCRGCAWLREEMARRLSSVVPRARVQELGVEPAVGAVRLAIEHLHGRNVIPRYKA